MRNLSQPGGGARGGRATACGVAMLLVLSTTACVAPYRPPETEPTTAPAPAAAPVEEGHVEGVVHVVTRGQTLWRIARAYGVTVAELAELNDVGDPTRIEVGQALLVPGAVEALEVAPYPAPLGGSVVARAGTVGFGWPLANGTVLSRFGEPRRSHRHQGLDIGAPHGERVRASADGRVIYSDDGMRGYGKTVILEHEEGFRSLYAHNSRLLVRKGDRVDRGQAIALVGRSGNATGEHCHFEIRKNRVPVDPLAYLEQQ